MIQANNDRCDRINRMLSKLSGLLEVPADMFQYREEPYNGLDAYHRLIYQDKDIYAVICANYAEKAEWRFLAGRTLDCVAENIQSVKLYHGQFYDYSRSKWHTDETLAASIYDRLCKRVFLEGETLFGFRFQDITNISEMPYEGDTAYGSLLFLPEGYTNQPELSIRLTSELRQDSVLFQQPHLGHVRKLLAGVKKSVGQESCVQGLAWKWDKHNEKYRCLGYIPSTETDQFPVIAQIRGYSKWILTLAGQEILELQGNQVHFPRNSLKEGMEDLREELDLPPYVSQEMNGLPSVEKYQGFLEALSRQHHGTSVVFLDLQNDAAAKWMDNLETHSRAQRVEPWSVLDLKESAAETIDGISRMDGCLIVDYPRGNLAYINVIVDGKAVVDGSLSSGSRRNSIPAFLANIVTECADLRGAAFLFSEDGALSVVRASKIQKELCNKAQQFPLA